MNDYNEKSPALEAEAEADTSPGERRPIAILLLEDNRLDAELMAEQLAAELDCTTTQVDRREAFVAALERGGIDLVLSDFSLPRYDGLSALEAARAICPEVPFIFVSGAIGEDLAIDTLRRGATDYVLKHRLDRLVPAVRRALQEAEERAQRRRAEAERDLLLVREREAREAAEAANRMKDDFLAMISHELRTPLNAMLGWLRLLREDVLPVERRAHALETVERNARAQAQLVEDLLDVSRIVTGKLRIESRLTDLVSVIEGAADAVRLQAKAKGVELHLELDHEVGSIVGDPARLQQVVSNLVTNAVKFTPPGGRVRVGLARAGRRATITVADTGQGIDPDFLPYVFERFSQATVGPSRRYHGLGLGLAIVKHLVELHGGSVSAESPGPGAGATFRVQLPIAAVRVEPTTPPERPAAGAPSLRGLHVLIVDDEPDARDLLTVALERYGAEVTAVPSAGEALRRCGQRAPDVLVSDIGMPGEDGYSLIQQVRALGDARQRRMPAVALSAYAGDEDSRRALAQGFQRYLPKPVEPSSLAAIIADLAARPAI